MKQRPDFVTVEAELNHGQRKPVVLFNDTEVLSELDFDAMAKMSRENVRSKHLSCPLKSKPWRTKLSAFFELACSQTMHFSDTPSISMSALLVILFKALKQTPFKKVLLPE